MANKFLFCSSILIGIIHVVSIFVLDYGNIFMKLIMMTGVITSILNHGLTSNVFKNLDRFYMRFAFLVEAYINFNTSSMYLMTSSGLTYFLSKLVYTNIARDIIHLIAHLLITASHVLLMI